MPDFDDRFGNGAVKRAAADDALDLACLAVTLALRDFARKDDGFEVEDSEIVIVKLFGGVDGHNVVQRAHKFANLASGSDAA